MEIIELSVWGINVGERARKDLGDLESLKTSIKTNGLLNPIIVNEERELLAGGRRLQSFKELKIDEIPCKVLKDVTADDKLIIELVENQDRKDFTWAEAVNLKLKIHETLASQSKEQWGYRATAKKLNCSLGGLSSDLEMAKVLKTFPQLAEFPTKAKARETYKKLQNQAEASQVIKNLSIEDKAKLDAMLAGAQAETPVGVNTVPTVQTAPLNTVHPNAGTTIPTEVNVPENGALEAQSHPELPAYTYKIGDFKELINSLPDQVVGFAELDPPYAIKFDETYGKAGKIKSKEKDWTPEMLKASMEWLFKNLYAKLLDNSWVLCWTGKEHFPLMNSIASNIGFSTQAPGVWVKPSGASNTPRTTMISQYEMFLLFRKGKAQFNTPSFPNVISMATENHANREHQWEKPIPLYNKFMSACARPGTIFLSPFAGSGASMVSAALNDMTPMGSDLQQKHFYRFIQLFKNHCTKLKET